MTLGDLNIPQISPGNISASSFKLYHSVFKTPKEHVEWLCRAFTKLASAGLKLKPSKCDYFKTKITYLGHVVSGNGIEIDPKKQKQRLAKTTNHHKCESFIWFY